MLFPCSILKNDELYFLFHLKSFFHPQHIYFTRHLNFCLDFLVMQKNGLIRKIRSISKFMTSQSGKQTIAIHMLPNISRRKDNQTVKFGQLIEYDMRKSFLACNFTNSNTPPWILFMFFELHTWYQSVQRITFNMVLAKSQILSNH